MAAACALAMGRGRWVCVWLSSQPAAARITDSQGEYEGRPEPEISPGGAVSAWPGGFGDRKSIR